MRTLLTRTCASILVIVTQALVSTAAEHKPIPYGENLLDSVAQSEDQRDAFIQEEAEKLAASKVPTSEAAGMLAIDAFLEEVGVDARENWRVTGLYRMGRDDARFAAAGDLIWEIRVTRLGNGLSGIIWVSAATKAVRILFPSVSREESVSHAVPPVRAETAAAPEVGAPEQSIQGNRVLENFQRIRKDMTRAQIIELVGPSDRDVGSGISIMEYRLLDGSLVRVACTDSNVRLVQHDGKNILK